MCYIAAIPQLPLRIWNMPDDPKGGEQEKQPKPDPPQKVPEVPPIEPRQNLETNPSASNQTGGNRDLPPPLPPVVIPPPEPWLTRFSITDWITAISTLVIMVWAGFQWWEMHSGGIDTHALANAAQQQAGAAQSFAQSASAISDKISAAEKDFSQMARSSADSVNATQAQMRLDQRAWIGVLGVDPGDFSATNGFPVNITFSNSGKTPARKVNFSVRYIYSPIPLYGPPESEIKKLVPEPSPDIPPQGRLVRWLAQKPLPTMLLTPSQLLGTSDIIAHFSDINEGRSTLYYFGTVAYVDTFGRPAKTDYCIYISDPKNKGTGTCPEFNDVK
jgi:hypothetical protein